VTFAAASAAPRFDLAVSFLVPLALYSGLALALSRASIFDFYNILFDADTNARLLVIAHGWGDYGLVHPPAPVRLQRPHPATGLLPVW
jgi:hypothetical protein